MPLSGVVQFSWGERANIAALEATEALCGKKRVALGTGAPFKKISENAFMVTNAAEALVMAAIQRLSAVLWDRGHRIEGVTINLARSNARRTASPSPPSP